MVEFFKKMFKRCFDIVVSLIAGLLLLPVFVLVGWQVRRRLGSPILFRQSRPGLNGAPFKMIKFRTMTDERDEVGNLMPDAVRLTRFGRFLRSTSLDELPELLNVFVGDMSLVGPRPLALEYLSLYSAEQARRHDVKPGITGWAQVNGRNAISWTKKFELDVWYVDNRSILLDIKILFKTVGAVLLRSNVRPDGQHTVSSFDGTN